MRKDKNKPYQLIEGDFREEGKGIESNSIPLVLVDSMYYEDSLNLHKDLARLADRVLRPGGCYAVYLVPQWREGTIRDYITKNSNLKECGSWTVEMQGQVRKRPQHAYVLSIKGNWLVLQRGQAN